MRFLLDIDTQTIYQIQNIYIEFWEWFVVLVMFMVMTLMAHRKKMMRINREPEYKYYVWGLYAKFFASVFFVIIFYYVYKGGDTYGYFSSAMSMANLFYKDPEGYFYVLFHNHSDEAMSYFDFFTGYPWGYLITDSRTFLVIKLISPLAIITYKSFLISNIILAFITYKGGWKLFQLFYRYYPQIQFQVAIAILFMPSVLFYGSGILKDSFTFMGTALFVYYFHQIFILHDHKFKNYFYILLHSFLIIGIKPYILMLLLPGMLSWVVFLRMKKIKNQSIKIILLPVLIVFVLGFTFLFFSSLGGAMDKFAIDKALDTASTTHSDLKKDYYEGKSFDIGNFDGSAFSALRLFPNATFAGLFRPFILEADSALVLLSALENLFLLYLFLRLFLRASIKKIYKVVSSDPILIFCLFFSLFFGFMLGITTSNFGALTRFKIPLLPFMTAGLFIINHLLKRQQLEKILAQIKK